MSDNVIQLNEDLKDLARDSVEEMRDVLFDKETDTLVNAQKYERFWQFVGR